MIKVARKLGWVAILIMPGSEISLIFGQKIAADQFIAHKQVQQLELGLLTVLRSRSFTPIMAWSQSPTRTVYSSTERQRSRHTWDKAPRTHYWGPGQSPRQRQRRWPRSRGEERSSGRTGSPCPWPGTGPSFSAGSRLSSHSWIAITSQNPPVILDHHPHFPWKKVPDPGKAFLKWSLMRAMVIMWALKGATSLSS